MFHLQSSEAPRRHSRNLHHKTSSVLRFSPAGADYDRFTCCGLTCISVTSGEERQSTVCLNNSERQDATWGLHGGCDQSQGPTRKLLLVGLLRSQHNLRDAHTVQSLIIVCQLLHLQTAKCQRRPMFISSRSHAKE